MIALWVAFVVACVVAGGMAGMQTVSDADSGAGQSRTADQRIEAAGLTPAASEAILLRSDSAAATRAAAADLSARLAQLDVVASVSGPADDPALSTAGGKTGLVTVTMRGDPDDAADHVAPIERAAAAVQRAHDGVRVDEAGTGTINQAFDDVIDRDLQRANVISVPIILIVLLVAFGALVAACVPLLLGITSVAAAIGVAGLISQAVPGTDSTTVLIVLIGLAVGVDYSLFYIRREREERRAGAGPDAALAATAATVGRAIVISGLTVMVALAGLVMTGLSMFTSMALATMAVVGIAMIGSVTVLPAVLTLLGDKVEKGRIPFVGKRMARRAAARPAGSGLWGAIARVVTRRPLAWLVLVVVALGALAIPALSMHPADSDVRSLGASNPVVVANAAIERAFPGAPSDADLVVSSADGALKGAAARERLQDLGRRAARVTGGQGEIDVHVARDGRTAVVSVPMPDSGDSDAAKATVSALRDRIAPTAGSVAPDAQVLVSGDAARDVDFTDQLSQRTPIVIAFVLGLAFLLLLGAFRSPGLAGAVIGLNLLSVGAAFGVLTAVFQHDWAQSLLDFTNTGAVSNWVPLFTFVILFGLSMDYTIVVLERMQEARRAGRSARAAAAEGIAATGSTITSAAVVMIGVFAIFATMEFADNKQLGVGLTVAVLLDATIVRGIALPAAVALLGERGWKVPGRPARDDEAAPDLGGELEALAARVPMPVSVDVLVDGPPPSPAAARAMLAVAEQALAQAGTRAHVRLCVDGAALTVQVTDRGPRGDRPARDAFAAVRRQLERVGGTLTVAASPDGATTVRAQL
jgi:RND superfamily putative drug exporter